MYCMPCIDLIKQSFPRFSEQGSSLTFCCTMAQCRDLENHHHEKLLEIAINTLEKIVKSEYDEEMPDEVRM
ncbi:hypothetical protein E2320_012274, partial [Naja naja]